MSMPDELSKYIHDFLRGESRVYEAKEKWGLRNCTKGFQVGQVFKIRQPVQTPVSEGTGWILYKNEYVPKLYTVVKVGAMVTFECDGKQIRRKPKLIKAHLHREEDSRHDHWRCDNWVVALDKETEIKFTDIYSPTVALTSVKPAGKRIPMKKRAPVPEPESDDEDVPLAVIAARIANNNY